MDGKSAGKKSLLIFLVLTLNAVMTWFGVAIASFWWYVLLVANIICAGGMAYDIIRIVQLRMKQKLAERAEHKVKRAHYRRMAM